MYTIHVYDTLTAYLAKELGIKFDHVARFVDFELPQQQSRKYCRSLYAWLHLEHRSGGVYSEALPQEGVADLEENKLFSVQTSYAIHEVIITPSFADKRLKRELFVHTMGFGWGLGPMIPSRSIICTISLHCQFCCVQQGYISV